METNQFIYLMLFLSVILTGREKMIITLLKSVWRDQTYEPIEISMLRMRVEIMMFYRMNITNNLLI